MVGKVVPVIGARRGRSRYLIAWLDVWAAPIRLDPNWNNGDYYGKAGRWTGLAAALKTVTLHAQHWDWANGTTFGRHGPAVEGKDPARRCLTDCKSPSRRPSTAGGRARGGLSDANHFLYLVKANQLFAAGGGTLADGLKKIDAPVLLISSDDDQVFHADGIAQTASLIKADGTPLQHVKIKGGRGHLDGVVAIGQAGAAITAFLAQK